MTGSPGARADLAGLIRDVPDFPRPGVVFKDVTGLLADAAAFGSMLDAFADVAPAGITTIAGVEARGFVLGAALAARMGLGFVPVRKAGKLPAPVLGESYDLEYGQATIELRSGTLPDGCIAWVVDDILATGGTAAAAARLLERAGAQVAGLAFLLEIAGLGGRGALAGRQVAALLTTQP